MKRNILALTMECIHGMPICLAHWLIWETLALLVFAVASATMAAPAATFQGIGHILNATHSHVRGVSADGRVVVGYGSNFTSSDSSKRAFSWSFSTGLVDLDPSYSTLFGSMEAWAASSDGTRIVGNSVIGLGFLWTPSTGMVLSPDAFGYADWLTPMAISADGSTVAGGGYYHPTLGWYQAFRWTQATGTVRLGALDGFGHSEVRASSADGSVLVGWSKNYGPELAFRWTKQLGMKAITDTPSWATAVSADGTIIAGQMAVEGTTYPNSAYRWTEASGPVLLNPTATIFDTESVSSMSADGSILVGERNSAAMIWDADHGMRDLRTVLMNEYGLLSSLQGWHLVDAAAISADGRVIAGNGYNPRGFAEGWVVTLPVPEPSNSLLAVTGLLGTTLARRRRQRSAYTASVKMCVAISCCFLLVNKDGAARGDWLIKSYSLTNSITNYAAADALIAGDGLLPGFPVSSQYPLAHLQDNNIQFTDLGLGAQFVGLPGSPTDSDNFVFVGKGIIDVTATGHYTFRTGTDDGSRLRIGINGGPMQQIIADDGLSGMHLVDSAPVSLTAGDKVTFDWMTFERSGGAESALLYWNGVAPQMEVLGKPMLGLELEGGSFTGSIYRARTTPISSFADAEAVKATPDSLRGSDRRDVFFLADTWTDGLDSGAELPPGLSLGAEHYFIQGTGLLVVSPDQAGPHIFASFSDDGARLEIDFNVDGDFDDDGERLIDVDTIGYQRSESSVINLIPGQYPIQYSFYNNGFVGGARVSAFNLNSFYGHVLLGDELRGLDVIQIPEPSTLVLTLVLVAAATPRFWQLKRQRNRRGTMTNTPLSLGSCSDRIHSVTYSAFDTASPSAR